MKKLQYILLCTLLLLVAACEKDTEPSNFAPGLSTGAVSDVYRVGATLSGSVQKSEGTLVKDCGILYSELQSLAEYTEVKVDVGEASSFSVSLQGLSPGKTYYYCTYASSGYSIAKGEVKNFTTTESNTPVFGELQVDAKNEKSFTVSAAIIDEGGSDLILRGFCWKEADGSNPTVEDNVSNVALDATAFAAKINDLMPDKEYVVCAYAINGRGVGYGKSVTVTTNTSTVPVVSSIMPTDSTDTSVQVEARILSRGETALTEKGFCWSSESEVPTTANLKKAVEGDADTFSAIISALKPETTYYIRAYAVNGQGVGYGDVFKFTAKKVDIPMLTTLRVSTSDVFATVFAQVTNGVLISHHGFEWTVDKENFLPDKLGDKTSNVDVHLNATYDEADGTFNGDIEELEPNTTYYVRAFAFSREDNVLGLGNIIEFKTKEGVPEVLGVTVTDIEETSVIASSKFIPHKNGTTVSRKGFFYGITPTPAIDGTEVTSSSEGNDIVAAISGLAPNTTYYIVPYVDFSNGKVFGRQGTFKTLVATTAPVVGVTTISDIGENTASVFAEITSDGGATITEKGFCYSITNMNPTIADSRVTSYSEGFSIAADLVGLNSAADYYICAYAINEKGISYGEVQKFSTDPPEQVMFAPTVGETTISNVSEHSASVFATISSDGGTVVTEKGFCYSSTSMVPTLSDYKVTSSTENMDIAANLTGLAAGTKYYVRAYADNGIGIGYGDVKEFTTEAEIREPNVDDIESPDKN